MLLFTSLFLTETIRNSSIETKLFQKKIRLRAHLICTVHTRYLSNQDMKLLYKPMSNDYKLCTLNLIRTAIKLNLEKTNDGLT